MIADSSAWIEFLRGAPSRAGQRMQAALRAGEIVLMPAVVLQEVLQGARDGSHFVRLRDALIAACAIESGEPLLHADVDFDRIATVEPRLRFA